MTRRAVVTGITGQDGAYLAQLLLGNGYKVFGGYRRTSSVNLWRLRELGIQDHENLELLPFDITDAGSCIRLIDTAQPGEIYNLAAQSFVGASFDQPILTTEATGVGALNMLEAVRKVNPRIRFYQASSSEMFGRVVESPQNESTPFHPRSPYGVAKLYAHWMGRVYREAYGMFVCSGILFNHESPLRGREFVTRKITDGLARYKLHGTGPIELGNLEALRDWGFAGDYVRGMQMMLCEQEPRDYVLATGKHASVRQFFSGAARHLGLAVGTRGDTNATEELFDEGTGQVLARVNPKFYRPAEVDTLLGDATLAREVLGWQPAVGINELAAMMIDADMRRVGRGESF
jgi:GDPmannose 4,6-dehydratase